MRKQDRVMALGLIISLAVIIFVPIIQIYIPKGSFWSFTGIIEIDDTNPLKSWNHTASTYDWCRGNGTWADPYIIENVTIDLTLNPTADAISIRNSNVYFILRNITIINSNRAIKMDNVSSGFIINCSLSSSTFGIQTFESKNNTIYNNLINSTTNAGIYLRENSDKNRVIMNNLINSNTGIQIEESDWNNITHNRVNIAVVSIASLGGHNNLYLLNNVSHNLVGIFLFLSGNEKVKNNTALYSSGGGIALSDSTDFQIEYNILKHGFTGLAFTSTQNGAVSKINLLENNSIGLYISDDFLPVTNLTIRNLVINNNNEYGMLIEGSSNNTIRNCNITNSGLAGILLNGTSENNTLYLNYISNSINAIDNNTAGINFFDNGSIGNFWSDYGGVDGNGDGIGDTPHNISGTAGSQDFYPLMSANGTGAGNGFVIGNGVIIPPTTPPITPEELSAFERWIRDNWWLVLILSIGIPASAIVIYLLYRRSKRDI